MLLLLFFIFAYCFIFGALGIGKEHWRFNLFIVYVLYSHIYSVISYLSTGDKLYVLEGNSGSNDGGGGEWEYSDYLTTHSSSRAVEHGFGGTLLLGSGTHPVCNSGEPTTSIGEDKGTISGNDGMSASARASGGLTRSSSGTSHDSAVDLFEDQPLNVPVIPTTTNSAFHTVHSDRSRRNTARSDPAHAASLSGKTAQEDEFERQLEQALALSVQESAMVDSDAYEQMSSYSDNGGTAVLHSEEEILVHGDIDGEEGCEKLPSTQESTFTFNTSSSCSHGGFSNSNSVITAGAVHDEPTNPSATHLPKQHKLYSLQELQQHKHHQQHVTRNDSVQAPTSISSQPSSINGAHKHKHQLVKKVRQEEKEEGEISTSAVSTFGSGDERDEAAETSALHKHAVSEVPVRQVDHPPVLLSPHSKRTNGTYVSTQQSEDDRHLSVVPTQDTTELEESEEQDTEPQFAPTSQSLSKSQKQQSEITVISPAEVLRLLVMGVTPTDAIATHNSSGDDKDTNDGTAGSASTGHTTPRKFNPPTNGNATISTATKGSSSKEAISLESSPAK